VAVEGDEVGGTEDVLELGNANREGFGHGGSQSINHGGHWRAFLS
jgi:hypothetical protein